MTDIGKNFEEWFGKQIRERDEASHRIAALEEALRNLLQEVDDDFMSNSGVCGWGPDEHHETVCVACIARILLEDKS